MWYVALKEFSTLKIELKTFYRAIDSLRCISNHLHLTVTTNRRVNGPPFVEMKVRQRTFGHVHNEENDFATRNSCPQGRETDFSLTVEFPKSLDIRV